MSSIWDSTVSYRRYKLAIMWSGGMDTSIAPIYAVEELNYKPEDIVLIHLDLGHPYNWKEEKAIENLLRWYKEHGYNFNYIHFKFDLLREELGNVPTPDKQIIPGRNFLIAWLGAFFADRIWIAALKGEMHRYMPDKNHIFFSLASGTLSYIFDKDIIVETPFANMSKSDIAKWLVKKLGKEKAQEFLDLTVTCYDEKEWACGKCSTCFKRWIAYALAGLDWKRYWKVAPFNSNSAKSLVRKYINALEIRDFSHYSLDRIRETLEALEIVREELDEEMKELYEKLKQAWLNYS